MDRASVARMSLCSIPAMHRRPAYESLRDRSGSRKGMPAARRTRPLVGYGTGRYPVVVGRPGQRYDRAESYSAYEHAACLGTCNFDLGAVIRLANRERKQTESVPGQNRITRCELIEPDPSIANPDRTWRHVVGDMRPVRNHR